MDSTLTSELFGDFDLDEIAKLASAMPPLDMDSSTIASGQSMPETPGIPVATMDIEPYPFNPQAQPFESYDQSNGWGHTGSKEVLDELHRISARLDRLEAQVNQLSFNLDFALPKIFNLAQEMAEPINELKKGLKSFTQGLVDQLVGDQSTKADS